MFCLDLPGNFFEVGSVILDTALMFLIIHQALIALFMFLYE